MQFVLVLTASLVFAGAAPTPVPPKPTAELAREARAAYDKGDKATFLKNYEEIARRRPGDVYVLYNLACGQALNGKAGDAERTLLEIAELRSAADLDADTDFDSIRQTDGYRKAAARMKALRTERISSGAVVAFTIPEKGLVPEGVAYDPITKSFSSPRSASARSFGSTPPARFPCSWRRARAAFARRPASGSMRSVGPCGSRAKRCRTWRATRRTRRSRARSSSSTPTPGSSGARSALPRPRRRRPSTTSRSRRTAACT